MRLLSRGAMLASLIFVIVSCASTPPQAAGTPTVGLTPTRPPILSPTPTLPKPPPLGLAPQDCPSSPVLKRIDTPASLLGTPPTWVGGFLGSSHPLLLFGENHTLYPWVQYDEHGWEHKFLYVVGPAYTEKVTLHGANLRDGAPLWLTADNVPTTTTSLALDPQDPTVVNRPGDWVEFPGGLDIPKAGCYYLQADWAGGSWRIMFAAGV